MRRLSAVVLGAAAAATVAAGAPQGQTPTFRARTDLIQIDVSVLDDNRMPVRGLSAADFTVMENGVARPVEAFAAVNLPDRLRTGAAWLRDVAPDVVSNRRDAQRVVLMLLDDAHTRWDPNVLKLARATARAVVDELGPADLAGVVYTSARRNGQELTTDRARLLASIERFIPLGPSQGLGARGSLSASIPSAGLVAPGGTFVRGGQCPGGRCLTDALLNAAEVLSAWPGARKTLILIGSYAPNFSEVTLDTNLLVDDLGRTFAAMQRANLNVYQFDPRGLEVGRNPAENFAIFSENTGGRATTNTNAPWESVPQVFLENSSYYLLGFRPTDARQDGRFRKVSVTVSRPDLEVRARAGYYAPLPEREDRPSDDPAPTALELALSRGLPTGDLPLSVSVVATGVPGREEAAVAVIAGLDFPNEAGAPATEVVEMVASAFTDTWKSADTTAQTVEISRHASAATPAHADVALRLELKPGRYEVRLAAHSQATGRTGSAFASVTVPDFEKARLNLSGVVIARSTAGAIPAPPTTTRTFGRVDRVTATVGISQLRRRQPVPVRLTTRIVDAADSVVYLETVEIEAARFGSTRMADHHFPLPLTGLPPGQYLLSFDAAAESDEVRRDVRFDVR